MPKSELRLIKNAREYLSKDERFEIPPRTRGIYVLYMQRGAANAHSHHYDFVYMGMATKGGIRGRISEHIRTKGNLWTHFSCFEVWDNISNEEITELEGLFRHLYQYDSKANALNQQKGYKKLGTVIKKTENHGWDGRGSKT